jgi:hypothetical protein
MENLGFLQRRYTKGDPFVDQPSLSLLSALYLDE